MMMVARSLYERDILNFDATLGRWTWDEEKAVKSRISHNVVELMVTFACVTIVIML
jgi:predicted ATPase